MVAEIKSLNKKSMMCRRRWLKHRLTPCTCPTMPSSLIATLIEVSRVRPAWNPSWKDSRVCIRRLDPRFWRASTSLCTTAKSCCGATSSSGPIVLRLHGPSTQETRRVWDKCSYSALLSPSSGGGHCGSLLCKL